MKLFNKINFLYKMNNIEHFFVKIQKSKSYF